MEFKYYDKSWLPAIKGAFLILLGIIAMLLIPGSIRSMASLFIVLIGMIGITLIGSGVMMKQSKFRLWSIVSGAINLFFCLLLALNIEASRATIGWILLSWILFQAVCEIIEAGILISVKSAFAPLFLLNALLTLLFGYALHVLSGNFNPDAVFNVGIIALVFGLANELSAYMLSRVRREGA